MPYVNAERRKQKDWCDTAGQLTYRIQQLLKAFLEERGENYETYSMMLGSLEGAKADLIDRKLLPYEAKKRKENGDVWE